LPPGYDANRAEPYPTLYLSHGGGGSESDWPTQGVAQNILANAIAEGRAQDMVLVMITYQGLSATSGWAGSGESVLLLGEELEDWLIPWVEDNYNVSSEATDRALAGLSQGGWAVTNVLIGYPGLFGYYGIWSPMDDPVKDAAAWQDPYTFSEADYGAAVRAAVTIQVGAGAQDRRSQPADFPGPGAIAPYLSGVLKDLGGEVVERTIPGVHSWDVWRWLLNDFVSNVAFADEADTTAPPAEAGNLADTGTRADGLVALAGLLYLVLGGTLLACWRQRRAWSHSR